jgi:chromosome segregation ATPase
MADMNKTVTWRGLTRMMPKLAHAVADSIKMHMKSRDEKIAALEAKLEAAKVSLDSFERRASRHAEHLARLETRLKAVEHR